MEEAYKKTYQFLMDFIKNKEKSTFNVLGAREYNSLAKEHNLLNTVSIAYITGYNWRDYKNYMIKQFKKESMEE